MTKAVHFNLQEPPYNPKSTVVYLTYLPSVVILSAQPANEVMLQLHQENLAMLQFAPVAPKISRSSWSAGLKKPLPGVVQM